MPDKYLKYSTTVAGWLFIGGELKYQARPAHMVEIIKVNANTYEKYNWWEIFTAMIGENRL